MKKREYYYLIPVCVLLFAGIYVWFGHADENISHNIKAAEAVFEYSVTDPGVEPYISFEGPANNWEEIPYGTSTAMKANGLPTGTKNIEQSVRGYFTYAGGGTISMEVLLNGAAFVATIDGEDGSVVTAPSGGGYGWVEVANGISAEPHEIVIKVVDWKDDENSTWEIAKLRVENGELDASSPIASRPLLLAYGDSITCCHFDDITLGFPHKAARQLGYAVSNQGVGGSHVAEVWVYPGSSDERLAALASVSPQPDVVLVMYGTNDVGESGESLEEFAAADLHMAQSIRDIFPDARLVRISIPPRLTNGELDTETARPYNEKIQENIAAVTGDPWEYLDIENISGGVTFDSAYSGSDVHPDSNAHTRIADAIVDFLSEGNPSPSPEPSPTPQAPPTPTPTSSPSPNPDSDEWWNESWQNRVKIVFDTTQTAPTEDLVNFPYFVRASGEFGSDIRFLDSDNQTLLPYEIETQTNTETLAWIKAPQIDHNSTADHIWMYYGNSDAADAQQPAAVWNENYLGVWHMSQDPSATMEDSTDNGMDALSGGAMASGQQIDGVLGGSIDFDGVDDVLQTQNTSALDASHQITLETWVRLQNWPDDASVFMWRDNTAVGSKRIFQLYQGFGGGGNIRWYLRDAGDIDHILVSDEEISLGSWYQIAAVYDGDAMKFYINGSKDQNEVVESFAIQTGNVRLALGAASDENNGGFYANAALDESRISNIARSAEWIAFEYCNMAGECQSYEAPENNPSESVPADPVLSLENEYKTYNGSPQSAEVISSTPGTVSDVTYSGSLTIPTDAGVYAITADFIPDDLANYNSLDDAPVGSFEIKKADADIAINPYSLVYDGSSHTAAGTVHGAFGEDLSADLDLSGTTHTNAGTYSDTWRFMGGANYSDDDDGVISNVIDKAGATIAVEGYNGVYDGTPHGTTGAATGIAEESLAGFDPGDSFTDVPGGTAHWTFIDITGNYHNASGNENIVISPKNLGVTVTGGNKIYDGTTSATVLLGSEDILAGDDVDVISGSPSFGDPEVGANKNVNVPDISIAGADANNYNLLVPPTSTTANISPQAAAIALQGELHATYDGNEHTVSAATNPEGLEFVILYDGLTTPPVNVGEYKVSALITDVNYAGSNTATLYVNKAEITVTADEKSKMYGESPDPELSYSITSEGGLMGDDVLFGSLVRETGEHAGAYDITQGTLDNLNYDIDFIGSIFTITKADQTVDFNPLEDRVYGDPDFELHADASSGLPVVYSVGDGSICELVGEGGSSIVHILGAGACTIIASQEGDDDYKNAESVSRTFAVVADTGPSQSTGGGGGSIGGGSNAITALPGDLNKDGTVDKYDFALLMAQWGSAGSNGSDINNDLTVDKYDFALFMSYWAQN
ncbi:hypothetical protein A2755_02960 [Candidatus Wolfebacteria bacterium RIFCSPHIGHO2_01_FULL_48_22]|uniref:LamG-like jellyroll fold domain-containing protein n=1 Tax=Candidatus Wolfebacteria bacterium RIFCSPHIGHO2_01_FULL_48_22 TaxID=1802555 RepID=A0A1F8DRS3_9BACT|nr:MAG: hypothetical protein A2755_02960 [Candidatus Wolfebacteria bacterium RIFCSPHIGHO2_01_FULL_48_22]